MANNLTNLNDILFDQIRRLENNDLSNEDLEKEIKKSEQLTKLSTVVLNNAKLALDAQKQFDEYGTGRTVDIPLLGVNNDSLIQENKNLRRRLAQKEAFND